MTTKLGCRDVEGLIIEGEDRKLAADLSGLVEDHLLGCGRCRDFAAERKGIREEIAAIRWPAPPENLVLATRRRLAGNATEARTAAVPAWVMVGLAILTVATGFWLAVSLSDVTPEMALADWPVAGLAAVIVIIQNALTLLLAPVVLRAVRSRRSSSESA